MYWTLASYSTSSRLVSCGVPGAAAGNVVILGNCDYSVDIIKLPKHKILFHYSSPNTVAIQHSQLSPYVCLLGLSRTGYAG